MLSASKYYLFVLIGCLGSLFIEIQLAQVVEVQMDFVLELAVLVNCTGYPRYLAGTDKSACGPVFFVIQTH